MIAVLESVKPVQTASSQAVGDPNSSDAQRWNRTAGAAGRPQTSAMMPITTTDPIVCTNWKAFIALHRTICTKRCSTHSTGTSVIAGAPPRAMRSSSAATRIPSSRSTLLVRYVPRRITIVIVRIATRLSKRPLVIP